jgi:hypothetical protein
MDIEFGAPNLHALAARVVARWPEHAGYVAKSLEGREPAVAAMSDELASIVLTLGVGVEGGVESLIDDYRFLCETVVLRKNCISDAMEPTACHASPTRNANATPTPPT